MRCPHIQKDCFDCFNSSTTACPVAGSPTWHLFHEASDETYFVRCDYLKSLCQLENP